MLIFIQQRGLSMNRENQEKFEMLFDFEPEKFGENLLGIEQFKEKFVTGKHVECPCCAKRYNTIYKRHLYPSIIKALQSLAAKSRTITPSSVGDFAKLRFWGLVKKIDAAQGAWEVTERGRQFLSGVIKIPLSVYVKNNVKIANGDEYVNIHYFKHG
jgi:hypothetical protein